MAEEEFVVSENERDNSEIQKESGKEWGIAVKNVSHCITHCWVTKIRIRIQGDGLWLHLSDGQLNNLNYV